MSCCLPRASGSQSRPTPRSCYQCHGSDYEDLSGAAGYNVHNPTGGVSPGGSTAMRAITRRELRELHGEWRLQQLDVYHHVMGTGSTVTETPRSRTARIRAVDHTADRRVLHELPRRSRPVQRRTRRPTCARACRLRPTRLRRTTYRPVPRTASACHVTRRASTRTHASEDRWVDQDTQDRGRPLGVRWFHRHRARLPGEFDIRRHERRSVPTARSATTTSRPRTTRPRPTSSVPTTRRRIDCSPRWVARWIRWRRWRSAIATGATRRLETSAEARRSPRLTGTVPNR